MVTCKFNWLPPLIVALASLLFLPVRVIADPATDQQLVEAVTKADNYFGGMILLDALSYLPQPQQAQARQRVVLKAVMVALRVGASPDAKAVDQFSGSPVLTMAVYRNYADVVRLLLDKGARVSAGDRYGNVPLQAIGSDTSPELVEALLAHGGDGNKATGNNAAPFVWVMRIGRWDLVEMMLLHHADVNRLGDEYNTPLMVAAREGRMDMVHLLLRYHADVNGHGSGGSTPLMAAAEAGRLDIIKLFLIEGGDIHARDQNGATALMCAAYGKQGEDEAAFATVINFLIERGLRVNDMPQWGMNALQAAAYYDHSNIVALLLSQGANPRAKNREGTSVIECARKGAIRFKTSPDAIVALLRAAGATK